MDIGTAWMALQTTVSQAAEQAGPAVGMITVAKYFAAALAIGIGVLMPGLSEGLATAKAVEGIARNPGSVNLVTRTLIIGQAVTESNSIYALVIALLILFVV
jgi:F-type H+-transporting ATPase subunit c